MEEHKVACPQVRVSTTGGQLTVLGEVSDEVRPGVVSIPPGWGHGQDGTALGVADNRPGVNNNLLAPTVFIDVPSNAHVVNGIPCEVSRA